MRLTDVISRLQDACPALNKVALLTDIEQIEFPDFDTPAALVLRAPDHLGDNRAVNGVARVRDRRFMVVLLARVPSQGDDVEPMETASDELLAALDGWQPDHDVFVEVAGNAESGGVRGGVMRWTYTFTYPEYRTRID